jgi:hypothetical protein
MFRDNKTLTFACSAEGTYGSFSTPAGAVAFVMTQGRLGKSSTDRRWRLTKELAPVREVLNIRDMDFNQLLQRDLDDHRIATELIPYVLKAAKNGPAFFPPIIAIVLPFDGKEPVDSFPAKSEVAAHQDPERAINLAGYRYGDTFQFEYIVDVDGLALDVRFSRVSWNPEKIKLVVMDGQHRAMALLAINRTKNDLWRQSSGEKYEAFYADAVKSCLAPTSGQPQIDLEGVEFPVCICWFPNCADDHQNPHHGARKLFVDINSNAKPPSASRLILLSDTELLNIFTRELLNRVRHIDSSLPLFAVEYDNPDCEASRPARWSVLTALDTLKNAVLRTTFGPARYIKDMGSRFSGRPNWGEMNQFMRDTLDVKSLFPDEFEDGPRLMRRDGISNTEFPAYRKELRNDLLDRFFEKRGAGIVTILSQLLPYQQHIKTLLEMYRAWQPGGDNAGQLAKDALFEGMGMYWTLRDGHQHYSEKCVAARERSETIPMQPDVSKAWKILDELKKEEFLKERARYFFEMRSGLPTPDKIKQSEDVFQMMNTQACQLGAIMTWASVMQLHPSIAPDVVAKHLVRAWNTAFTTGPVDSRDRRLFMARSTVKFPINVIRKLDTPMAVYFRYFWLELLCCTQGLQQLGNEFEIEQIESMRSRARTVYLDFVISENKRYFSTGFPEWKRERLDKESRKAACKQLNKALKYWFGLENTFDPLSLAKNAEVTVDMAEADMFANETDESTIDSDQGISSLEIDVDDE